ncbi:hypothetical protein N7447_010192 [Penicillium robsamsonii]|uniref:uncharacterized protein n=1 Tax=Penicillium robsamsonii TaxID=1792511 RepID=UPI0025470F28|nr:uncharacterized protein N7447_010192 [Penicillium robsamsonii]KAJ5813169.1 hypothetical protein N7447_010192 [Penicillium robsamsonii]
MDALNKLRGRLDKNRATNDRVNQKTSTSKSAPQPRKSNVSHPESSAANAVSKGSLPWPVELKTSRFHLKVLVYSTTLGRLENKTSGVPARDLNCWVFVSSGLASAAGGELVMVLLKRESEGPTAYPLDFLRICDRFYGESQRHGTQLRRWQMLEFEEPLLGRKDFHTAILGFRNATLIGMEIQEAEKVTKPYYHVMLSTDEEVAVSRQHGMTRAFVVRPDSAPFFPCPPFVNRDRESGSTLSGAEGSASLRTSSNQLTAEGLNVVQAGKDIYLLVPPSHAEGFKNSIPFRSTISQSPLRVESEMHEACDSVYYWGDKDTHPARRLCSGPLADQLTAMNFLNICPNQPTATVMPVEDGCLVFLTVAQSKGFFTAAISGTEFSMSTETMSFHLRWSSPWPLPAQSKLTDKAIFLFTPSNASLTQEIKYAKGAPHIELGGLIFLRQPSDDRSVNVEKFAQFVETIDEVIASTVPKTKPTSLPQGCGICVQFQLPLTSTSPFKLAATSSAATSILPINTILDKLGKLPCIDVFAIPDVIEIQVLYSCWGFQISQFGPPTAL